MSAQTLLSGGDKWYSYSGEVFGDVSAPATIGMIFIPNTGLRDSIITIDPFFGTPVSNDLNTSLGITIKIDDVTVYTADEFISPTSQSNFNLSTSRIDTSLFVPRQSKLEIISLNTTANNTQIRGVNVLGYYL
jgi:hypothetical protein